MKILLVLVAGVGFVTGIGLGSVAARQIASRALAQQGTPPLTVPAHEAATRPPASVRPSPRGSVPAEGEKATAVGPTEDDPGDLDDTVDDVVPA